MCSVRSAADDAHAAYSSARASLLSAVADVLSSDAWHGDGAGDPASWFAARWQMSLRTARELVRDAEAMRERPALVTALSDGSISIDQCKALTVLGDAGSDDVWLEALPFWSYGELAREARKQTARELDHADGGVYLRMTHTPDERFLRGAFQLHPADGAVLIAAIDALVPSGTALRDYDTASALALVELARGAVCEAERPTVLLAGDVAELSSGGVVGAETARRLSCDATLAGKPVPASTRRAVEARDNHRCTFPGCERGLYLQCHHIVHRADGGSNDLSNLQLVCWQHHKLIHEGGWSLRGQAGPRIGWVRPDGTPFEPRARGPDAA
jgi:hypothetical protein